MRIFAKEWVSNLLQRLGMEEGVPIESRMITKRIESAQKAVEAQNFEARKHLLEYDDVMNKQREAVYGLRRRLLEGIELGHDFAPNQRGVQPVRLRQCHQDRQPPLRVRSRTGTPSWVSLAVPTFSNDSPRRLTSVFDVFATSIPTYGRPGTGASIRRGEAARARERAARATGRS